jgi:paraquat-inducible protein B
MQKGSAMSEFARTPHSFQELPKAKLEKNWKTHFFWLVPIAAAALAGWFIYSNLFKAGPTIHIYFDSADGVEQGKTELKYRGASLGEVKSLKLTPDHQKVEVTMALTPSGKDFAREGTRFWIVKPEVGAAQISGLRTIVSGDYITGEPGKGEPQKRFTGLSDAPVVEPPGTLRIRLLAEKAGSLKERSPVFFRDVQIGEVFKTDLGPDSQTIQITVDIDKRYAPLVRMNSKFWRAGGIHANLSLSGLNISAESAKALLSGAVEMATPDASEKEAPRGTDFRLYDKPDDAWLAWSPMIQLDNSTTVTNKLTPTSK